MKTPKPLYTFEIYREYRGIHFPKGDWYWRCRHRNGKIIADGAEGYSSKAKLRRSLERFLDSIYHPDNYEIKEL